MPDYKQELYNKIKSGEYFREAFDWYGVIYLSPIIQRLTFLIILLTCILFSLFALAALYNFLPLVQRLSVAVEMESLAGDYADIRKLQGKNPQAAVTKYLLANYVKTREYYKYDLAQIEDDKKYIKTFSSDEQFKNFQHKMDFKNNPESVILKYRQNSQVAVEVLSIDLINNNQQPDVVEKAENNHDKYAKIYITKHERGIKEVSSQKFQVDIGYSFSDIVYDEKSKSFPPVDLKVKAYNITKL